jgi:hypothetical protein
LTGTVFFDRWPSLAMRNVTVAGSESRKRTVPRVPMWMRVGLTRRREIRGRTGAVTVTATLA